MATIPGDRDGSQPNDHHGGVRRGQLGVDAITEVFADTTVWRI
jgi:hypothetical protein